jgi:hypothetical protein
MEVRLIQKALDFEIDTVEGAVRRRWETGVGLFFN